MKTSAILAILLAVLLAGGGLGWTRLRSAEAPAGPPTALVTRADVSRTVLATGAIEAAQLVSVGARVSGQIETVAPDLGDTVQQGDLIAQIDDDDQTNALLQAKANLAQIEAQIVAKEASITEAQLLLDRRKTLNEKNLSSTEDLQAAEASLAVARAERDALKAQKDQADVSVASAQTELDRTRITAPITGTVVAIVNDEGTTVNANQSTPTIVKLAQLDKMVVKAEISEADVVNVKPGLPVSFTLAGAPELRFDATLRAVEPAPAAIKDSDTIDTETAIYYDALLDVDNPDGVLRIGMTANVTITLAEARGALTVPSAALHDMRRDGSATVQVWDPSTGATSDRTVKVGLNTGVTAEIADGLSEGERVVTTASGPVTGQGSTSGRMRRPPMMGL